VRVAYFLVSHGSSAPRSLLAVQSVRDVLRKMYPQVLFAAGCLEGQDQSLTQQCRTFAEIAYQQGYAQVQVIPLFLLAGSHVLQDIPTAIAGMVSPLPITITNYLGNFPSVTAHLEQKFCQAEQSFGVIKTARLLICHGSRQAEGMQRISQIGDRLSARIATWSDQQTIVRQIEQMLAEGAERICALPYFLFAGKTTNAIAEILQSYPTQVVSLALPFSVPEIAEMVREAIVYQTYG